MAIQHAPEREDYQLVAEGAPYEAGFGLKTVWASFLVGCGMLPGAT